MSKREALSGGRTTLITPRLVERSDSGHFPTFANDIAISTVVFNYVDPRGTNAIAFKLKVCLIRR